MHIAPGVLVKFDHLNVRIGAGCHPYLQAPAVEALKKAIQSRGVLMTANSAYRTLAQQAILFSHFQNHRCGIRAAARPGASNHNTGLAIDIEDAQGWRPYLERQGWDWIGSFDPMHFDFVLGSSCKDMCWLSIKAFQQLYNLSNPPVPIAEDGKWGMQTSVALAQVSVDGFKQTPTKIEPLVIPPQIQSPQVISSLRQGMRGVEVLKVQQALRKKGWENKENGIFDGNTTIAVEGFQLEAGLVADGVVGAATKKALGLA
jgi:hypothetical protein